MNPLFYVAAAAAAQQSPATGDEYAIIVTASREPIAEADAAVSATLFEREELESLALPFAVDVLQLVPGV